MSRRSDILGVKCLTLTSLGGEGSVFLDGFQGLLQFGSLPGVNLDKNGDQSVMDMEHGLLSAEHAS